MGDWATDDNLSPEKQPLGKHQVGVEKKGLLKTIHGSRKMFLDVLRIGGKHQGRGLNGRRPLSKGKSAVNETLPIFYISSSDELEMSKKYINICTFFLKIGTFESVLYSGA